MAIIIDVWMVRSFVLSVVCAVATMFLVSISAACTIDTTSVRNGLTSLYHSTNGPHWKQNENWLSSDTVCTWYGISEDPKGRARIRLSANNLSGTLPPELAALSDVMQTLDLQGNALHGSIPQEYSNFSNLEYVFLYNNSLNGTLPSSLSSWTRLIRFESYSNNFSGTIPPSFKTWTPLTKFAVAGNFFSGSLPEDFASWTALTDFSLAWNCFSGTLPDAFGAAWTKLQHFGVDYQRANWKPCGDVPGAGISGKLPVSYALWGSSLLSFRVSHNRLSGTLPAEYGAWNHLSVFEGWSNNISGFIPESYAAWTYLTRFMVADNKLDGTLHSALRRWSSLASFVINGNCMTGTLPDEFSSWTNISKFDVSEMVTCGGLSGTLPTSWARWQRVENIALNGNNLNGSIPEAYTAWTRLTALMLYNNRLCGTVSSIFGHAWNLTVLAVDHNELNGTLPESLAQWTHLTKFTISNNRFTGSLPATYEKWRLLKVFDVSSNNLNTSLPSEYSAWHSLETFHAGNQTLLFGTLPSAYSAWSQIKKFSVCLGRLNGSIPIVFKSWEKLEEFDVHFNTISGTLPASMGMGCLLLKFFQASRNNLVGTLPASYGSWKHMQTFNVTDNALQGTLPVSYSNWTSLEKFGVSHNFQIVGTLPFEYGSGWKSKLVTFDVLYCQLNSTLPTEYGSWVSIKSFYASHNRLSGTIPKSFLSWGNIQFLYLDNNNLEGTVPPFNFLGAITLHNNSGIQGELPNNFFALFVTLCGTGVPVCHLNMESFIQFVCASAVTDVSLEVLMQLKREEPPRCHPQQSPLPSARTYPTDATTEPPSTTTRTYVAGVAAVLASAAGSAASGVAMQRLRLSVREVCPDGLATVPVDTVSAPIRISIAPASLVADTHRAAVLGNCVLLTAIGLVSVTATAAVALRSAYSAATHRSKTHTKISRHRHMHKNSWCSAVGRNIGSAAAMLKLPSALSLVMSMLFQQTVLSGIVTLRYAQVSVDVALGVAGCVGLACVWLLFLAVVLLMNFHATANPSCFVDPLLPSQRWWSLLSWLVAPQSVWHAIANDRRGARERRHRRTSGIIQLLRFQASKWYVDQYGFFFRGNSPRCHWWLLCDYVVTVVSVICVATAGSSGVPCAVSSWILVAISGVWCGLTIAMAPKQRRLAQFAQCVTTGVACIVALCDALSVSPIVTEALVMTASVQHTAASVLVLVGTFLLGKRQQANTESSRDTPSTTHRGRSTCSRISRMLQKQTEGELDSSSSVSVASAPMNGFATRPGRVCRTLRDDHIRSKESGMTSDSSLTSPSAVLERLIATICRGASFSVEEPCQDMDSLLYLSPQSMHHQGMS